MLVILLLNFILYSALLFNLNDEFLFRLIIFKLKNNDSFNLNNKFSR
jgi:hypothetical protein